MVALMPASSDRTTLIAALEDVWDSLIALAQGFTDEQWQTDTEVPGWTVKDNYSHVIGIERMLLDRADPKVDVPDYPYIRNDIGRLNEISVELRRPRPGAEVLAEFVAVTADRRGALEDMTDADFEADSFTPAGPDTYGRFMQIRTMDCWVHEQDVREALGIHGHLDGPAASVSLDEMTNVLGYVVGKRAGAEDGQSVRFQFTGPTSRTIDVRVDGRAAIVHDLTDPTTTITMPSRLWWRYASGRRAADLDDQEISITGDSKLGIRVLENCAFMV